MVNIFILLDSSSSCFSFSFKQPNEHRLQVKWKQTLMQAVQWMGTTLLSVCWDMVHIWLAQVWFPKGFFLFFFWFLAVLFFSKSTPDGEFVHGTKTRVLRYHHHALQGGGGIYGEGVTNQWGFSVQLHWRNLVVLNDLTTYISARILKRNWSKDTNLFSHSESLYREWGKCIPDGLQQKVPKCNARFSFVWPYKIGLSEVLVSAVDCTPSNLHECV